MLPHVLHGENRKKIRSRAYIDRCVNRWLDVFAIFRSPKDCLASKTEGMPHDDVLMMGFVAVHCFRRRLVFGWSVRSREPFDVMSEMNEVC